MSEFSDTDIHANERFANRQRFLAFGLIGILFAGGLAYVLMAPSNPEDRAREAASKTRLSSVDPRDAEALAAGLPAAGQGDRAVASRLRRAAATSN